jgi:hypothetical protein
LRYVERTLAGRENGIYDLSQSAYVLARAGQRDRARDVLKEMERRSFWGSTASGYITLGDTARALAALEKDYELRGGEGLVEQITVAPGTAAIRSHPRVKALRQKLGLPQ